MILTIRAWLAMYRVYRCWGLRDAIRIATKWVLTRGAQRTLQDAAWILE